MKNEQYFMTYYKNLAMLKGLYNKDSLFFATMISRADADLVVRMTAGMKIEIIDAIGSKSKKPANLARQYLSRLVKLNLIANLGGGDYKINPLICGFSAGGEYLKSQRHNYSEIVIRSRQGYPDTYETCSGEVLTDDDGQEYIIDQKGNKLEL